MKFSYNWLRELTGTSIAPRELGQLITMKTAECEGVEAYAPQLAEVVVARVLSVEELPGGHNRKAVVDAGRLGERTLVCGAPNCRAGMLTVYWPIGKKTVSGIESDGMLASGRELGINRDHEGILELASGELGLAPDWLIEIDNKSLTHRPDLWGHYGMAREVAAITGTALRDPVAGQSRVPDEAAAVRVAVEDFGLCPRYSALVFENVTVGPSPLWLQYRLEAIGLNSINNIVDVTNLIMAEMAQPMHAFDAAKLQGDTIFARPARKGESIAALNGESYSLTPANLVIADANGPIAIAGVIGGAESAISSSTKRIVFESANFQASSVRKTSSGLKLRTDASMRFEKAQDPENTVRALERAIELLEQVSPGIKVVGGLADAYRPKAAMAPIDLPLPWLYGKLGREIADVEVRSILESIGFGVEDAGDRVLRVTVPSWRATKDVSMKDDLVEEVGRMIGYASIAPEPPMVAAVVPPSNPERMFHRRIRALMTDLGFTEVSNYSFISEAEAREFGLDPAQHLRVTNPIAEGQDLMRSSLIPGALRNVRENAKHFESFRLFEIGREIHARAGELPDEIPHLVAAIYARESSELFELKRVALCLAPEAVVRQAQARAFEHPARAAVVEGLGRLFEVYPSFVEGGRAAILDIDLRALEQVWRAEKRYAGIRRYPTSAFDLSMIGDERRTVGEIEERLRAAAESLVSIEYLRQYSGAPLAEGQKSVSFRLTVGAADRTLSSDEIAAMRERMMEAMRGHGYSFR